MNILIASIEKMKSKKVISCIAAGLIVMAFPLQAANAIEPSYSKPTDKSASVTPALTNIESPNTNKRKNREELTKAVKKKLSFSMAPSDAEIASCRAFSEPLVAMDMKLVTKENQDLSKALLAFASKNNREDISDLTSFLAAYPNSRWRASLEAQIAQLRYESGFLSQALKHASWAWELSKRKTEARKKAVADKAFSNLVHMESRLGMVESLDKHMNETADRAFTGTAELLVKESKNGLWSMKNHPEIAFRCGPLAIDSLIALRPGQSVEQYKSIKKAYSSKKGTSLAQVAELSRKVGLNFQIAKRQPGAKVIVPSVMHWSVGHFSAVTQEKDGRFRVQDPTFGNEHVHWLSMAALDAESDGYFLIPQGHLPTGWTSVSQAEASNVWGKGLSQECNPSKPPEAPTTCPISGGGCSGSCPMAKAVAFSMNGTLKIFDYPLSYSPALGPEISIGVNYNYLEGNQPATFTFSNLTPCWSLNWVSYLIDDGSQTKVSVRGGGYETYENGSYATPDVMSQATLTYNGSGGGSYTRNLRYGSSENFTLQNGSGASAYWLMTSIVDPQGNAVTINWDVVNFRIESISDANGQITTFNYVSNSTGNSGYYLISNIVDPTGRKTSFTYDSANAKLLSITDAAGIVSKFFYDETSSFINQLTTPYGSTTFAQYVPLGFYQYPPYGMRTTYPDGSSTVIENWPDAIKESYFWDREATALYPHDPANRNYAHCKTTKWMLERATGLLAAIPIWIHPPLESPTVFSYPNESNQDFRGSSNKPILIAKQTKDVITTLTIGLRPGFSAPQAGDVLTVRAEDQLVWAGEDTNKPIADYTVKVSDTTVADVAAGIAAAVNAQKFCQSFGISATSSGSVVYLKSPSTNRTDFAATAPFGVGETMVLADGINPVRTGKLTGTVLSGDLIRLRVIDSALSGGSKAFDYTAQTGDTPAKVVQALSEMVNLDSDMQAIGVSSNWVSQVPPNINRYLGNNTEQVDWGAKPATVSVHSNSTNATTISTFVSGFGSEVFSTGTSIGIIQYQAFDYNELGYITRTIDGIGRQFDYSYASNNIDLLSITETQNNSHALVASWEYNSNHRPTLFTDASLNSKQYAYNSAEQLTSSTDALSNTTSYVYNIMQLVTIGGTTSGGDALSITVAGNTANYTTISGDTPSSIAMNFARKINLLGVSGIKANVTGAVLTIAAPSGSSFSDTTSGSVTIAIAGSNTTAFPVQIQGPLSGAADIINSTWNFTGTLESITNSQGYTRKFSYDNLDRTTQVLFPDGSTEQVVYNRLDAVMTKDRLGRWSQNEYDNLDQLKESTDPLGRKTKYCWCDCGSIAELTDPAGHKTAWHHDLQGRVIQKVYADGTDVDYSYGERSGWLDSITDALGQVTSYRHNLDNSHQITQYSNEVNATSDVSVQYDPVFPRTLSSKNGWGKNSNEFPVYDGPILLTGTPTTNDVVNFYITNSALSGGSYQFQYQVTSGDTTLTALATSVKNAVNGNGTLSAAGITATSSGALVTLSGTGSTIAYPNTNGVTTITLSLLPGTITEALTKTVVVIYDPGLNANGYQEFTYTTASNNEPLSNCTSSLASSITSALSGNGITASASGATLTITSTSLNQTTVSSRMLSNQTVYLAVTGGSTEVASSTISSDGANAIRSETNNVIPNSAITYTYDALNRISNRSINSSSNSTTWTFDAIGRVTSEVDPLGTFNFSYVDNTSGSSKGDYRLSSISYPNSQTTNFTWLPNILDQRLHQIVNLNPSSSLLSQFNYGYNATGEITQWQQQQNSTNKHFTLGYDQASQLTAAPTDSGSQFKIYVSGTTSASETFSVTAYDASLTGATPVGQETATYNASASASPSTVATNLASQINSVMGSNLGISASASGGVVTVNTSPSYTTSFSVNRTGQGTFISVANLSDNCVTATVSGAPRTGDATSVTAYDTTVMGGQETASYTVQSGDTTTDIAAQLATQINLTMSNVSVTASSHGPVITIIKSPSYGTTFSASAPGNTETIAISDSKPIPNLHTQKYYFYDCAGNRTGAQGDSTGSFPSGLTTAATKYEYNNVNELVSVSAGGPIRFQGSSINPVKSVAVNVTKQITIGGSVTAGDQLWITTHDKGLPHAESVSYTVQSGDSTTVIATALKNAINGNSTLTGLGVSATSSAAVITISSNSIKATTYTATKNSGATETISLSDSVAASGTVSPSTEFIANPSLSGGSNTATVTAVSGGGTPSNNPYAVTISSVTPQSLTYDDNGNMTSDGTNTFAWDAEKRLIEITYPGSGNNTQFTYDPVGTLRKDRRNRGK